MFTSHCDKTILGLTIGLSLILSGCLGSSTSDPDTFAPIVDRNISVGDQPEAATTYTGRTTIVRPGDNLYSISFVAGFDYRDVAEWNDFDNPEQIIHPGQEIKLFPPEGKELTHYQQNAPAPPPPAETTIEVNQNQQEEQPTAQPATDSTPSDVEPVTTSTPSVVVPVTTSTPSVVVPVTTSAPSEWIWPAQGKVEGLFSQKQRRNGIHIGGNTGSPIKASANGQVVYSGTGLVGYGRMIIVKHSPQYLSVYAHNSRVVVKEGDSVVQGQKIAEMGSTDSDTVKLHFEIRKNGTPVDPLRYLPKG